MSTFKGGNMEKHLLTLWQAISTGNIKQTQIAESLGLSSKQTTRQLRKWSDEGWFTFTPGRGRGNTSHLHWQVNVEEVYEQQLAQLIEEQAVDAASKFLLFDWSPEAKLRLLHKFRSSFGYVQNSGSKIDKLIIPRRYPLMTLHPLKASDIHSANMVSNVYSRLVTVHESGHVSPELAHSWDLTSTNLRLYLRKEVKFHDGSFLTAKDVVDCLNKIPLRSYGNRLDQLKQQPPMWLNFHFPAAAAIACKCSA